MWDNDVVWMEKIIMNMLARLNNTRIGFISEKVYYINIIFSIAISIKIKYSNHVNLV